VNLREIKLRLLAWHRGKALPRVRTFPWPNVAASDTLIVSFLRMGGVNWPWGIAVGHPNQSPQLYSVTDPRDFKAVSTMLAEVAPTILNHVDHPSVIDPGVGTMSETRRLKQLWVAGPSHVNMLHLLEFFLSSTHAASEEQLVQLRALGRTCGWLFREAQRPGQFCVMDATYALTRMYAFPTDEVHQQHLGFLLAWLAPESTRDATQEKAMAASKQSVSITLSLERAHEEWLYQRLQSLRTRKPIPATGSPVPPAHAVIRNEIEQELNRRWTLTHQAWEHFQQDPRPQNPEIGPLMELAREEFDTQYWNQEYELLVSPQPEKRLYSSVNLDRRPNIAASRYFAFEYSQELMLSTLIHGDLALLEQAVEEGIAFRGCIQTVSCEQKGRSKIPRWTIVCSAQNPLRLRQDAEVSMVGHKHRLGRIRGLEVRGGNRIITIEITHLKTKGPGYPGADERAQLEGKELSFVASGPQHLTKRKSQLVFQQKSGPGAWLTHGQPSEAVPRQPSVPSRFPKHSPPLVRALPAPENGNTHVSATTAKVS
jgi:hypothetical protein